MKKSRSRGQRRLCRRIDQLQPSQDKVRSSVFEWIRSHLGSSRFVSGVARHGLLVCLGMVCALVLVVAARPRPVTKRDRPIPPVVVAPGIPDTAWRVLPLSADQRSALQALRGDLHKSQRATIKSIKLQGEVLRRELRVAESTPGQEVRAAGLRRRILLLTQPLQYNQAEFVQRARSLLTTGQKHQLNVVAERVRNERRIYAHPHGAGTNNVTDVWYGIPRATGGAGGTSSSSTSEGGRR